MKLVQSAAEERPTRQRNCEEKIIMKSLGSYFLFVKSTFYLPQESNGMPSWWVRPILVFASFYISAFPLGRFLIKDRRIRKNTFPSLGPMTVRRNREKLTMFNTLPDEGITRVEDQRWKLVDKRKAKEINSGVADEGSRETIDEQNRRY